MKGILHISDTEFVIFAQIDGAKPLEVARWPNLGDTSTVEEIYASFKKGLTLSLGRSDIDPDSVEIQIVDARTTVKPVSRPPKRR